MLLDSVFSSLSDASPYWMTDLHDTPQFIRPMIRYSIIGLLIAARFIDNTEVSVFHIVEIPCYNSETAEWKKKEARDDFEEKFRVLCEVKAVENEVYRMQETQQNVGYDMECTQYTKNRNTKAEMKLKIREKTIDPNTRKELRTHYIRKQQKNKRCIEDLKRKLTRQDDETKGIIYSLQKNRLKS
uniref:Uncharacterized protein n=1 Tax=Caenorhabditis tropicalis TaxID=1561998 RepID=A0A1I7TQV1_9PELO